MPNGVTVEYGYDAASQLTGLNYKRGQTTLGDLSYDYDAAGRRTQVGGSFVRTGLPEAVTGAVYDDANRLTSRGAQTFTYDDNGNLTSDGQRSYTWDARNRLTGITGATQASFSYDAFGRRTQKSVGGSTTSYLYDGSDAVQEVAGGGAFANMLTGGVDEVFTRTEAGGASTLLQDGLGSTLALLDSSGNTQTSYTYEPFGQTTSTSAASGNASKFTGREDDGTGLYYYRARYYSPASQRFISEDPIGFAGGDVNLYAYVGNDPINYNDPSGLDRKWYDLGQGWRVGQDSFSGGTGFELHVYDPTGREAGIVSGADGWIAKHGHSASPPSNIPSNTLNRVNGINVDNMRRRGVLPPAFRKGGYLNPGRRLWGFAAPFFDVFAEYQAQRELILSGRKRGLTPEQEFYRRSKEAGHPDFYMTTIGPMPNPYAGRIEFPEM